MSLITWNNCLKAEDHTCSHGVKKMGLTGGLFLMFIPSSTPPTGHWKHCGLFNSAVYWQQATVSLPLYDFKAGKTIFQLKIWTMYWEEFHSPFWGAHKSRGNTTSLCTLNLGLQTNWSDAWPEIALIYGVITEFCCSIDMLGCLCFGSRIWLITMKLSGLRGKQTGLMLPVVWCVWWHISCSNRKSYRGMLYYTASLQYVCASRLRE